MGQDRDRDPNLATGITSNLTRRSLLRTALASGVTVGMAGASPLVAFGRELQRLEGITPSDPAQQNGQLDPLASLQQQASLSRELARWVADLRYEDLPAAVVDRAKGVSLQALASVLLGSETSRAQLAVDMITEEETGVRNGATIMVHGTKVTKGGAAFANAAMANAGGKWDTFRMLIHSGTTIIPCALLAAETSGASGRDFITGVAAGYEVMNRLTADYVPTVMARGFHPGVLFSIFGPAVAAAKILGFTEDQVHSTISQCVALAISGRGIREQGSARNAMLAIALVQQGLGGAGDPRVLEGDGGFYWAYAGSNEGILTHSFVGETQTSLDRITANLGEEWLFLDTLYRIYSTAGYNIAHVDVTAQLCEENDIRYEDVDRVEAVVNWLETHYPSPEFPTRREDVNENPRPGSTRYYTAYGVVQRGFPILGLRGQADPPEVLDLMRRVRIIPSTLMPLFGPRITIFTKDGMSYTKQGTGREFIWDFEEEARRISGVVDGIPIPAAQFEEMISTCRDLDRQARADRLIQLTLRG